nr:uncharacterized protein CFAP141 [Macaca fascicularis]
MSVEKMTKVEEVAKFTYSLSVANDIGPEKKPVCHPKDAGHHGTGIGTGQKATTNEIPHMGIRLDSCEGKPLEKPDWSSGKKP